MNNKGTAFIAIISAIFIFFFAVLFVSFIEEEADQAMATNSNLFANEDAPGLDCDNSAISDGTKLTCLAAELATPYFIILLLSIIGGIIIGKLIG